MSWTGNECRLQSNNIVQYRSHDPIAWGWQSLADFLFIILHEGYECAASAGANGHFCPLDSQKAKFSFLTEVFVHYSLKSVDYPLILGCNGHLCPSYQAKALKIASSGHFCPLEVDQLVCWSLELVGACWSLWG